MDRRTWLKSIGSIVAAFFWPWKTDRAVAADDCRQRPYVDQCERIVGLLKRHQEWCLERGAPLLGQDARNWDVSGREVELHGVPRIRVQWQRIDTANRGIGNAGVVIVNPSYSAKCDGMKLTWILISASRRATDSGLVGLTVRVG
jgi:hypothetical protein